MMFLNDAILGIPNLAPILNLKKTVFKDTGPNKITLDDYLKEIRNRAMKYDLSECFSSDQNFHGKKCKNPPTNETDFCEPQSGMLY